MDTVCIPESDFNNLAEALENIMQIRPVSPPFGYFPLLSLTISLALRDYWGDATARAEW